MIKKITPYILYIQIIGCNVHYTTSLQLTNQTSIKSIKVFWPANNIHLHMVIKLWVQVYFTVPMSPISLKLTHPSLQTDQGAQQVLSRGL